MALGCAMRNRWIFRDRLRLRGLLILHAKAEIIDGAQECLVDRITPGPQIRVETGQSDRRIGEERESHALRGCHPIDLVGTMDAAGCQFGPSIA